MAEKIQGIVLDVRKHNDKNSIVTLYTRSKGRLSFLFPIGSGKGARLRMARMQPLSVVEADVRLKPTSELHRMGDFSLMEVWCGLYSSPVKIMVVLFLSEFLNRLLKATMPDENVWDYIVSCLRYFDRMDSHAADFHIVFLLTLLPFAGIQPDFTEWEEGSWLDMRAGVFTALRPTHKDILGGDEAAAAARLLKLDFSNIRALKLTAPLRSAILGKLLQYYSVHYPGIAGMQSQGILGSFSGQ